MSGERFTLDTNIIVYSADMRDMGKQAIAAELIRASAEYDCPLALQAIGEFHVAALRKLKLAAADACTRCLDLMTVFETFPHSANAIRTALAESAARRFGFWDAVLLASAAEAGCTTILSEDMGDGARLGSIVVRNPFGKGGMSEATRELLG